MKISNSKKQLAKIISENGGWRDGARFAAQDSKKDSYPSRIGFYLNRPEVDGTMWLDGGNGMVGRAEGCINGAAAVPNWHQTILSRDEYLHLYPAPDAVAEEPGHVWTNPPTIEQLASEDRNRRDYAERKQQEADEAKAEAEAKLAELVAAGKAVGLAVSVAALEPEAEKQLRVFRNEKLGPSPEYNDTVRFELCEECGRRFGVHFCDANHCPLEDYDA